MASRVGRSVQDKVMGVLVAAAVAAWSFASPASASVAGEVIVAWDGTAGSQVLVLPSGGIVGGACGDLSNGPGPRTFVRAEPVHGGQRIVVYDEDCGSPRTLLSDETLDISESVRWSRDATRLAFAATQYSDATRRFERDSGIFVGEVVRLGADPVALLDVRLAVRLPERNIPFSWAPGNRRVALSLERGGERDIWIASLDAGTMVKVTNTTFPDNETDPDFSPSGDRIAFAKWVDGGGGRVEIFTMPSAGGAPTRVTEPRNTKSIQSFNPSWSPDGASIAFSGIVNVHGFTPTHILRIKSDGSSKAVDLTPKTDHYMSGPEWRA